MVTNELLLLAQFCTKYTSVGFVNIVILIQCACQCGTFLPVHADVITAFVKLFDILFDYYISSVNQHDQNQTSYLANK